MEEKETLDLISNLDPKIWAAIIGSIGSLIIAIISLINSNRSLRKNLKYQKELEIHKLEQSTKLEEVKIKFQKEIEEEKVKQNTKIEDARNEFQKELEETRLKQDTKLEEIKIGFQKELNEHLQKLEFRNEELKKSIASIENGISKIQYIKSALQLILNSIPDKIDLKELTDNFELATNAIVESYQTSTSHLERPINAIFHDAKNASYSVHRYLENTLIRNKKGIKPPNDFFETIKKYRDTFSGYQESLRDFRFKKISENL